MTNKNLTGPTGNETVVPGARDAVPKGPAAPTQTVTYVSGGSANKGLSAKAVKNYYKQMQDYYNQMYQNAVDYNNSAATAAAEYARQQVDVQKAGLNTNYDDLARQLYRDYMLSLKVLPQYLSAMGFTGGASESAKIGLDANYGDNLNSNERKRINELSRLDSEANTAAYNAQLQAQKDNAAAQQSQLANLASLVKWLAQMPK